MLSRRAYFGDDLVADVVVLPRQHLLAEELDDRREVGLLVEFLVVELDRVAAQQGRGRDHRYRQPSTVQMGLVGLDDLTPVRVQIDLGGDDRGDRAYFECLSHEGHFGFGELLAGVSAHQQRVGVGQQAQRGRQVGLAVTADPRRVHERQSVLEKRAGGGDLDPQHFAPAGLRSAPKIGLDVGHRYLDRLRLRAVGPRDDQPGRGILAVGHHRRQHGALVVADARHGHVQQRVGQLALAALQLACDDDANLGVGDAVLGPRQAFDEVTALSRVGDRAGVVDELDDDLDLSGRLAGRHLAGVAGLRHEVPLVGGAGKSSVPTVDVPTGGDRFSIPASDVVWLWSDQKTSTVVSTELSIELSVAEWSTELS